MIVAMQTERRATLGQVRAFVEGNEAVDFAGAGRRSTCEFIGRTFRAVMRLEFEVFVDARFERLSGLSNGHRYSLVADGVGFSGDLPALRGAAGRGSLRSAPARVRAPSSTSWGRAIR